jgi:hypothetical protein
MREDGFPARSVRRVVDGWLLKPELRPTYDNERIDTSAHPVGAARGRAARRSLRAEAPASTKPRPAQASAAAISSTLVSCHPSTVKANAIEPTMAAIRPRLTEQSSSPADEGSCAGVRGPLVAPFFRPTGGQEREPASESLHSGRFRPLDSTRLHPWQSWGTRGRRFESVRPDETKGLKTQLFRF